MLSPHYGPVLPSSSYHVLILREALSADEIIDYKYDALARSLI